MAKAIMPFRSMAAQGKMGASPSSLVYQRTGGNCAPERMVTVVKGYRKPLNPNTSLQQAQRSFFAAVFRAGKPLKDAVKKG